MSRTLERIREALRRRMHANVRDTAKWLGKVLGGWLNYYAVPGSIQYLYRFVRRLKRLWLTLLRRRSQKDRAKWTSIARLTQVYQSGLVFRPNRAVLGDSLPASN